MKTIFFMIVMVSVFPAVACQSNQILTGRNGTHFCLSEMKMNWWSAHQWCQAQGYVLAHLNRACASYTANGQTYIWQDGFCHNLDGHKELGAGVMVNVPYDGQHTRTVFYSSGTIKIGSYTRTSSAPALCDMGD